jgi:hypothetical protein
MCVPSRSRPAPKLPPLGWGLGHSIPSQHFESGPDCSPFNRKCPDLTLVQRKSLPGQDYGRTPSSGPDGPGPDRLRVQTPRIRVPSRPWTLDPGPWISEIPSRSRSRPVRPVPINPVPIRSRPGHIRPMVNPNGAPLPLAERRLGLLSIGYPFFAHVMFQPSPRGARPIDRAGDSRGSRFSRHTEAREPALRGEDMACRMVANSSITEDCGYRSSAF